MRLKDLTSSNLKLTENKLKTKAKKSHNSTISQKAMHDRMRNCNISSIDHMSKIYSSETCSCIPGNLF